MLLIYFLLNPVFFFIINSYLIDLINHDSYLLRSITDFFYRKWKIPNITVLQPTAPRVWILLLNLCHMCICLFYVLALLQILQAPLELELLTTLVKLLPPMIFGPLGLQQVTNSEKCGNRARTDWLWTRWSEYAPLMHGVVSPVMEGFCIGDLPEDGWQLQAWLGNSETPMKSGRELKTFICVIKKAHFISK